LVPSWRGGAKATTAPLASSANFVAGQTVANGALTALGADGSVCVTSNVAIDVVVDVQGWFGAGSPYHPIVPTRVRDTRDVAGGMVRAWRVTSVAVNGAAGFEPDATAVAVNVTVTNPESAGHLRIWACESPPPDASSINFAAAETVANLVVTAVSPKGAICVKSSETLDLVVDVVGSFTASSPYHTITPVRIADTRHGEHDTRANVPANGALEVPVAGERGEDGETVVDADATAVVVNLTITNPNHDGYATVYACGQAAPFASNVNFTAGATVAGAAISAIGTGGKICVTSSADVDVIVDVQGWFGPDSPYHPMTPTRLDDTRG